MLCLASRTATLWNQDVVGPGAHLLAAPVHGPCADVLQPQLVTWEEVSAHFLQSLLFHVSRNPLVLIPALYCGQVSVEIVDN